MRTNRRRGRAVAAAGAVAAALAVAPLGRPSAAAPALTFAGTADAVAVQAVMDSSPSATAPIDRPATALVAAASTAYDAFGAITATASLYDPGATVAGGPTLLCEQFLPCPAAPPQYPLTARASFPTQPADRTDGPERLGGDGAPLEVTPAGAAASAAADSARGDVAVAGLTALPEPGLVRVAAATTRSEQRARDGLLSVMAWSRLTDVDVAGVLHLDALEVRTALELAPDRPAVRSQSVVVEGATVLGQAVRIDERGVHAAGQDDDTVTDAVDQTLRTALAERGVDVWLVEAPEPAADAGPRAAAYGLLIDFTQKVEGAPEPPSVPVPGLPGVPSANRTYTGTVLLGAAAVAAYDVQPLGLPELRDLPAPGPVDRVAPGAPSAPDAFVADPLVGSDLASPQPSATSSSVPPPGAAAGEPSRGYALVGLDPDQVRLVYLALAALAATLLLLGRARRLTELVRPRTGAGQ